MTEVLTYEALKAKHDALEVRLRNVLSSEQESIQRAHAANQTIDALAVENQALKDSNRKLINEQQASWPIGLLDSFIAEHDPQTPTTSAALAAIRDKYRAEGINFAANRLLAAFEHGFIDKPAGEVADVANMILSAVTELPGAPEEDFTRDYSDEVIALIRAELREAK